MSTIPVITIVTNEDSSIHSVVSDSELDFSEYISVLKTTGNQPGDLEELKVEYSPGFCRYMYGKSPY